MQGRNSQPIPTFLDKKARPNEGFVLRKSQGSAMPAAPKTAVRAMYLTAREKICSQVSVWDCGSRQTRVGTRFAVTKPVMTSKPMSELPSANGLRVRHRRHSFPEGVGGLCVPYGRCWQSIHARYPDNSILHSRCFAILANIFLVVKPCGDQGFRPLSCIAYT